MPKQEGEYNLHRELDQELERLPGESPEEHEARQDQVLADPYVQAALLRNLFR